MAGKIRRPAHAGTFYPADPEELTKIIEWAFQHPIGPGNLPLRKDNNRGERGSLAFIVPHAGYIYSGPVAAHSYYWLSLERKPEVIVIAGPNHTGMGDPLSIYDGDYWMTPFGLVEVDREIARVLQSYTKLFSLDSEAHYSEHSVEVQIPFLQYVFGNKIKIVPVVMEYQSPDSSRDLGQALYRLVEENGVDLVYIASTDFNHYEPHDITIKKDMIAINAIIERDEEKLFRMLEEYHITMCGPGPAGAAIVFSKLAKGSDPILLKHATSGDVTGEKDWVVGYASLRFPL